MFFRRKAISPPVSVQQAVPSQTTENASLEEKMETVLKGLKTRLLESEVSQSEYFDLIYEGLSAQGILTGSHGDNSQAIGYSSAILGNKLGIVKEMGLKEEYVFLPKTPLSEAAKTDIAGNAALVKGAVPYVRAHCTEPIPRDVFEKTIEEYVTQSTPGIDSYRRAKLEGQLWAICQRSVVVENRLFRSTRIGEYAESAVEQAVKKARV